MGFKGFICMTDKGWFDHLSQRAEEEVNFWRPSSTSAFRALSPGEPLLFKLKKAQGGKIVGFGFYLTHAVMNIKDAWDFFGQGNGVASLDELRRRVVKYANVSANLAPLSHQIGCILLSAPVFFPETHWVDEPSDWKPQIVQGKGYDLTVGEGKRIWRECLEAALATNLTLPVKQDLEEERESIRLGKPRIIRPRLGQGTFRLAVRDAYKQCAVTGEHALPALDAAHIKPFASEGPHTVSNGLLLRADIHRLFDGGYVTVSPDYEFKVSDALDAEFGNGKLYYAMEDRKILLPEDLANQPDRAFLECHRDSIFRG